jgi:opacity protein-like surface antigen
VNIRFILIMILISTSVTLAEQKNDLASSGRITARLSMLYIPVGTIKFISPDTKNNFYDNLAFRISAEYFISDYFSLGPGIEYLSKHVKPEQGYPFDADIKLYNFYFDCRYSYPLTDSETSYLVMGIGTGIGSLDESGDARETGFCLYGLLGFDIALSHDVGLDLLYRYQTNRMTIDYERNYRFEGSALQAGLNYRFKF